MAKPLIIGNWKAYVESLVEARKLLKGIDAALPRGVKAELVVCPPTPFIHALASAYRGRRIAFGAQGLDAEGGKHTGAETAAMLSGLGVSYVIVGHSEQREEGDTDGLVAKKIRTVFEAGLTPILAVGERARDTGGQYLSALEASLLASLAQVESAALKKLVIAYEPVWAVGASSTPTAREIRETVIFLRKTLASRFDRALALKVRIIYGGDVNAGNASALRGGSDTAGFLIGRASIDAREFSDIVRTSLP